MINNFIMMYAYHPLTAFCELTSTPPCINCLTVCMLPKHEASLSFSCSSEVAIACKIAKIINHDDSLICGCGHIPA